MSTELARTGIVGLGDQGIVDALATLLSLSSDAVLAFDEDGTIVLANDEAERMFRACDAGLVGSDVRMLFLPPATLQKSSAALDEALPFALDGSSCELVCEGGQYGHVRVRVRCERVSAHARVFLLTAHASEASEEAELERERLVEELSRANKRLSGTLHIVLGTLDSLDVGTLFTRILSELADSMDAWAALAYMAEQEGYRLRGTTESLGDASQMAPTFIAYDHPLAALVAREGKSVRLSVLPPKREDLRKGRLATREVREDETGMMVTVEAGLLPPFASFVLDPVWFGGHMIALLVVGWRHSHRLRKDDARLLDSVAEYLSVQLAGAFAALRAQHAEGLESLGTTLRERLLSGEALSREVLNGVFGEAAVGLEASLVPLAGNPHQRTTMAVLPVTGVCAIPIDLKALTRAQGAPAVMEISQVDDLVPWLTERGEHTRGMLAVLGEMDAELVGYLLLRAQEDEPFEEIDLAFVRRLAEDVAEVSAGERARTLDKRIAQALQRGMRNELQVVEGLSTQSRYSSATEAAYVGGDFFDLVRLPERHACVVMGDVSGKGVEAASVSSAVKTALSAYAWEGLSPARMVGLLNDFLLGFSRIETFATLFVGMVDLSAGVLTYCSAGHPPALLVRAQTGELVTLSVQSGVVGAFEGMRYRNGEVPVRTGDIVVLYTDGVTEARNSQGAFFGEDGLRDAVAREVAQGFEGLCDRLLDNVAAFSEGSLDDDVAVVIVRFDDVPAA